MHDWCIGGKVKYFFRLHFVCVLLNTNYQVYLLDLLFNWCAMKKFPSVLGILVLLSTTTAFAVGQARSSYVENTGPIRTSTFSASDKKFLDDILTASETYNREYADPVAKGEPRRKMTRQINGLLYQVNRYNHGLAHGVRQAFLAKKIVTELRRLNTTKNELVTWLKQQDEQMFIEKVKRLALYYRIGRENEFSPSNGTDDEKARFDKNMHTGAALFKTMASKSGMFDDEQDIDNFATALFHYEFKRQEKSFEGDTRFIDQIVYAAHILDLRRVNASWNQPPEGPEWAHTEISEILGFHGKVLPVIKTLTEYSGKLLLLTGDRDAWRRRGWLSDDFFFQAYSPELMLIKLNLAH